VRTSVYIDGFNLYYALKPTRYKWLDVSQLCRLMLPKNTIHRIRYFTARLVARPGNPGQLQRQDVYLRALGTIQILSVHLGTFLSNPKEVVLADSPPGHPRFVRIIHTEEKGSDVNLATHLLLDGFRGDYEVAVVISNDSDLMEPIRVVREELKLPIGVLCPHDNPSRQLRSAASFWREIRTATLAKAQFADVLTDEAGEFHKPERWNAGAKDRPSRKPAKRGR
jgi:NYN domain